MKIDLLAIGVHPDDVELCCSGTILRHLHLNLKVGIVDLTQGELGTRGNPKLRMKEAQDAANILGVSFRTNLGLQDGFFRIEESSLIPLIKQIRLHRPEIILANALIDRHPDHGRAADLVNQAAFLSGLVKIETQVEGKKQARWRPKAIYHYIQDEQLKPDLVVDITPYIEVKMKSIHAFRSQFFNPESKEPDSPISGKDFIEYIYAVARKMGRHIGVPYAEGFNVRRPPGINNLLELE